MRLRVFPLIVLILTNVPIIWGIEIAQVGVYDFGVAYDIVVSDNIAFVTGNDGVDVFDISDKRNPIKLTRISNNDGAFGVFLIEDTLYIACDEDGFFIADVSNPRNPVMLGSIPSITALKVYVEDVYAYVAHGDSYSIVDIRDSREPYIISTVMGNDRSYFIHVIEDTLYLGETNKGLMVYDILDKNSPEYIRTISGTIGIFDIQSNGDTLYLGCHGNGVKVLDVSIRDNPKIIGSFNNGGEAYGIHIVGDYLMVADLQQGVEILDISNPSTPTLLASWTRTHPHGIFGDDQYVYLADQDHGLEIFIYGEDIEGEDIEASNNRIPLSMSAVLAGLILASLVRSLGNLHAQT